MSSANVRRPGEKPKIQFKQPESKKGGYSTIGESLTVDDKLKILEEIGKPELIDIFKEWKPRPSRRRKTAPLDQRVSILVSNQEKIALNQEIKAIAAAGEKINGSQFIRNKAMGNIDINGWRDIAVEALKELDDIESNKKELNKKKLILLDNIESNDEPGASALYEKEISQINAKLSKLTASKEKRPNRLSGRMSLSEAETVKWRAQRLMISASDYLRMVVFNLEPYSRGDAHMSLDSKRRFYVSIIDVADNGWGDVPTIYNCQQCGTYLEEIEKLRDRVKQLESFV